MNPEDMTLEELFAAAEEVGSKYQTEQEIADAEADLFEVQAEFWNNASDELLDLL